MRRIRLAPRARRAFAAFAAFAAFGLACAGWPRSAAAADGDTPTVVASALGEEEYFIRTAAKVGQTHIPSVRSRGMGGAYTALSNGAASVNENPAALGAMTGKGVEAMIGYDKVDDGDDSTTEMTYRVGGAMSLNSFVGSGANQTLGLAYTKRGLDRSTATGEFDQDSITLAYGSNFGPNLLWGVSLTAFDGEHKYAYNRMTSTSDTGAVVVSHDTDKTTFSGGELAVGVLYRLGDDFTVGGLASYGGGTARSKRTHAATALASDRHSGDLDMYLLRAGAAWQISPTTLLAGDLGWRQSKIDFGPRQQEITEFDLGLGVEHALIPEKLVARAGANYHKTEFDPSGTSDPEVARVASKESDDYVSFMAGVGARIGRSVDINYTLDLRTNGDIGNFFGAQFGF